MIQEELNKRQDYLRKIIRICDRATANVPEGSLRVTKCRTTTQYFLRKPGDKANGIYLPKDSIKLVKKLAEKEVYEKLKREAEREYKDKIKAHLEYKETIKKIFRAKSFKTAMKYYHQLYDKLEELPPIIKNFIKTLSKKINKALEYTKDKKIPKTNNLVELLFKVTFPGKIKRIYRTYAGAITQIKLDDLKWIERNVLKKTGENKIIS